MVLKSFKLVLKSKTHLHVTSRTLAKARLVLRHADESTVFLKIDQRNIVSELVSP